MLALTFCIVSLGFASFSALACSKGLKVFALVWFRLNSLVVLINPLDLLAVLVYCYFQ
ncbi:putative membrane protein [Helicobacter pylori Hp P-1]|nr:putative membrane protein [Helicobacter pylori Hp P-1]EJC20392.1 putative membrane protein [Helicobacter pylori Hp P-1b]